MAELIDKYFAKHLELPWDEAVRLHKEYYTNYGLAIEGLVRHHQIDPLKYNAEVDDALPLEDIIKPDEELRKLLEDLDKTKVRIWLFTNAYVNHAKRVVRLLGIDDLFDGLTFCDYSQQPLICKPHPDMYRKGMEEAGAESVNDCYFVGMLASLHLFKFSYLIYSHRRFVLELYQGAGVRLDGRSLGGRESITAQNSCLQASDSPSQGAARHLSTIFQVHKCLRTFINVLILKP